jgi:hypothetical protein
VTAADDAEIRLRQRRIDERRELAAAIGVVIPVMPPRNPGESDREYGVRIAWIAKSYCGPPPRPKTPPRRPAKPTAEKPPEKPPEPPPEDRLSAMVADPTTEEDP